MQRAIERLRRFAPEWTERSIERILCDDIPFYRSLPPDVLRDGLERTIAAILADIESGTVDAYPAFVGRLAAERVERGAAATDLLRAMHLAHDVASEHLCEVLPDDLAAQLWWERLRTSLGHSATMAFASAYMTVRESLVRAQRQQIDELSSPVVPLYHGVLFLPLVGTIDAARAARVLESLLEGVARNQAWLVLIDITGVPSVDAQVVSYFGRAAQACRLMGAEVALAGVSPRVARAVVALDVPLTGVTMLADLRSGVEYALRTRNGRSPNQTNRS